jgi:methionyl-tRNA formyltransferase
MQLRIVFAGTPAFAVPTLDAIIAAGHHVPAVYTQPDRPAGRGRNLKPSEVKMRALELELAVEQPLSMRMPETLPRLRQLAPDVLVVVAYGLILPQSVLDVPRLGCFNIHASLLPRWRGAAPIQQAILAGDSMTGVTIMRMTAGLDEGPILAQREQRIDAHMTAGELHDALAPAGATLMVEVLDSVAAGTAVAREQDAGAATYAPKISKDDARIVWSDSAASIVRRIRAYDPWPGAAALWRGEQIKIWRAEVRAGRLGARPGEVLSADASGIEVACGNGSLALRTLQLPGRKRIDAADFLHAHSIAGDSLS